jgi:hypothetical protein
MGYEGLIYIGAGAVIALVSSMVGAFIMFRGKNSIEGSKFLGGVPKGEVFTVKEVDNAQEFPKEEEGILERTERFLNQFNPGGKES